MEWINVEDRLPKTDVKCLWFDGDEVSIDIIRKKSKSDGGGFDCVYNYLHNYTHWAEITPPKK